MSNRRPQTSGARAEAEMKDKASRAMANAKDPVEKLRLFALSRGAKGIMGLGRYLKSYFYLPKGIKFPLRENCFLFY